MTVNHRFVRKGREVLLKQNKSNTSGYGGGAVWGRRYAVGLREMRNIFDINSLWTLNSNKWKNWQTVPGPNFK